MSRKSIRQIKKQDYEKLVELIGKQKADRIFEDDPNLDDDSKYPIKVITMTILMASIKKFIIEKPFRFIQFVLIAILIFILIYTKVSYYW